MGRLTQSEVAYLHLESVQTLHIEIIIFTALKRLDLQVWSVEIKRRTFIPQ